MCGDVAMIYGRKQEKNLLYKIHIGLGNLVSYNVLLFNWLMSYVNKEYESLLHCRNQSEYTFLKVLRF